MITGQHKSAQAGFTLFELLIALSIFAVVISVIYGSFSTTFHTLHIVERQYWMNDRARVTLERIVEDLESVYLQGEGFFQGERGEVEGKRGDTMEFTSTAHLDLNQSGSSTGYTTITYSTGADDDGSFRLYRLDEPYRPAVTESSTKNSSKGPLLCDGLQEIRFIYIDSDQEEYDNWKQQESGEKDSGSREKAPSIVKILLRFADGENDDGTIFQTAVQLPR